MEFLKPIRHRAPKTGWFRQRDLKNRRRGRSRRGNEAEVFFSPKSAPLRRRLVCLNSPRPHDGAHLDAAPDSERDGARHLCRFIVASPQANGSVHAVSTLKRPEGRAPGAVSRCAPHSRAWMIWLVLLLGAGFFAPQIRAQAFKEYDLKATFL